MRVDFNSTLRKDLWNKCWLERALESQQRNGLQLFDSSYVERNRILFILFFIVNIISI